MTDFTIPGDSVPVYDFESISGEHYQNDRTLIFCTKEGNSYFRYEIALEISNDTQSSLIPQLSYGFCKAAFYSDWDPADLTPYVALCVKAPETVTAPIKGIVKKYNTAGGQVTYTSDLINQTNTLTAGVWRAIRLFGYGTDPAMIDELNTAINDSSISETILKPLTILPADTLIQHPTIGRMYSSQLIDTFTITVNGEPLPDPEDTYTYGEESGPGGGQGGSFDSSSDSVDFASLPSGGAAASGLVSMFAPTAAQLASFGQFLWATLFDGSFDSLLTSLKKWVNDPIESVIQLSAYPVSPPAGGAVTLKFCGIRSDIVGSGVSMNKCTSQFMDFDFGQLATPAYWKQALDYSPYTKVSIYLPYIGICPLAADDVIDAVLHLKYHIDLLTGGFSAELKCTKNINGTALDSVLYNWSGNMATQIPITSSNFSQVFGSMMTAVAAIGVGAVTGGMGAAAAGGGAEAAGSAAIAGGALSGAGHGLAANIGNVINSKPHVTQSGRLDGTVGALSQFTPYLIIERPVQSLSSLFQKEQGYPSNVAQRLGDLKGLTVCEAPIMNGFNGATEEEIEEIRSYLVGGVIL